MEVELEKTVRHDYTGYLDVDRQFHEAVISASGNHHLSQLMKSLRDRIQMLRHRSVILPGRARKSFQEHLQIIDALEARDPDLAEERIRTHIGNVKSDLTIAMADRPAEPEKNHRGAHSKSGKKSRLVA
jgi:DNA-binding GntR family transcriptional regulator